MGNSDTNLNIELLKYQQCSQEALTNAMRKMKTAKSRSFLGRNEIFSEEESGLLEQITITTHEELELLICYEQSFLKKKQKI